MKLTIKSLAGTKEVVELSKDLLFNTSKGDQYIFSKGFTNYVLNFKDNQKSVELTFNVDGKSVKVELKNIVPHLQENIPGSENPTAVIINKNISDKDVDLILDNAAFNGSEIIDRLEALLSKPVELGTDIGTSDKLTLISDFQTLIESLDAAAAGPGAGQGGTVGNGSTFNSIFSSLDDSLNGIADTDRWLNLSESISNTPVETGNTVAIPAIFVPTNVNVKLVGVDVDVTEGENATYKVTLTDDFGNPILATQDMETTYTYTYTTASGNDIVETVSVTILAGTSETAIIVQTLDDNISEGIESFTIELNTVSNQTQFDSVTIDKTPVDTTITDETVPTPPDAQTAIVSITGPSDVIEGDVTTPYTVSISQAPVTDLTVTFTYTGVAVDGTDFTGVASVVIPAGQTSTTFTIATLDDNLAEGAEKFTVAINPSSLGAVGGLEDVRVSTVNKSVDTTITDKPLAPEITNTSTNVSEEGLLNGIKDTDGIIDTTDKATVTGTMVITDGNNDAITVTLVAPTTELKSNGQVVVWTGTNTNQLVGKVGTTEVIKVSIDNSGNYKVELLAPVTHPINSVEDILSLNIGVKANDGVLTSTGILVVNIEDDMPKSCSVTNEIDIQKDVVVVKNLEAGFKDTVYINGTNQVTNTNTDGDSLVDKIQWGTPADSNNGQSGYNLLDSSVYTNSIGTQIDTNGAFKLADFTHQNWTINSGSSTLDKTTITMKMDVVINGKAVSVEFDVLLDHDETPNSNDAMASRDIITLPENDITINVDGQNYTFTVEGFRNSAGEYVKTIYTNETANNNFEIYASIKQAVELPVVSGNVCADAGADGLASVTWENLNSQYGTMSVDANGGYVFTVNQTTKDNLEIGESLSQEFTYTITDKDGDKSTNTVTIKINGIAVPNAIPTTTDDIVSTDEDKAKILSLTDFGTYNDADADSLDSIQINTLPTNGILTLSGVVITSGTVISASDIIDKKLIFTPNTDTDEDSSFKFKVSDGKEWSSEYTTTVNITAGADKPTASIDVVKTTTVITLANVTTTSKGYEVNAYDTTGTKTTISTVSGTSHDGFGVTGGSTGDANSNEIGYNSTTGKSEEIRVTFVNDVSNIAVKFAWKHAGTNPESAVIKFYKDGVLIDTQTHIGGTDTVDGSFAFAAKNGLAFDEVRFSALGTNDDYLINEISFNEVQTNSSGTVIGNVYDVNLSAALNDLDGSETLTVEISGVPKGATFNTLNIVDKGNGIWELTVPSGTKSITDSLKMTVPESAGKFDLTITARATETNDNLDGKNFAESTDNDAIVYSMSETNNLTIGQASSNLVITLDVSGSMATKVKDSSGKDVPRFEIEIDSMIKTIQAYKVNGKTDVNLTLFGDGAKNIGWMNADAAIDYLSKLTLTSSSIKYDGQSISGLSTGGTDYDSALKLTMGINFSGHNAHSTVAYFLSDGEPNKNTSSTNEDSDDTIKNWKAFVDKNINTLNVVGIGSGAKVDPLKIVQVQAGDKVIMAVDDSTLGNILLGTVTVSSSGDVFDNISGGDGIIKINSIEVNGSIYNASSYSNSVVTINNWQGELEFNFASGKYTYTTNSSEFSADSIKTFKVNASDIDGDASSFNVSIKVDITPNESVTTLDLPDNDTIDLTSVISNNYKNVTDIVDMTDGKINTLKIDMNDVVDLVDADKELIIKGDLHDKVDLDTPSDWSNAGKTQLDGTSYKVFTGIGINSTIKLLIEDDIDVIPDI